MQLDLLVNEAKSSSRIVDERPVETEAHIEERAHDTFGRADLEHGRGAGIDEGRPYSPCRHPEGEVHGVTFGTSVFQLPEKSMTLYHGNPCLRFRREYDI